jgi:MoaA/NifB/PqqE/SkfB family radical SAM enzyme
MMFTDKKTIRCHIELSNYCNAACSMCGRHNISNKPPYEMKIRKDVDNSQISFEQFKQIFDQKFFDTFDFGAINMCGNRGDPITATDLFEICDYIVQMSPTTVIKMATNGGLRTPKYWSKLGEVFARAAPGSEVTFGVDGLEDTNHIYRQRVNFKKVMENAQAFIDAGGDARWQFLIFKHNEHQLEEAYDLSVKMGFSKFITIHTPRFAHTQEGDGKKRFQFQGKDFVLETADPEFKQRQEAKKFIDSEQQEGVNCKAMRINEFYIDNKGRLLPCCWIGNSLDHMEGIYNYTLRDRIMNFYDVDEMNVIKNDLTETVLTHTFLNDIVPFSWNNLGKDCASHTCKNFCGKKHNLRKKTIEYSK